LRNGSEGGAEFVSPGFNPAVLEWWLGLELPVYAGVRAPTEAEWAISLGLRAVKFFPAEAAGSVPNPQGAGVSASDDGVHPHRRNHLE
jgi:2-keto-3-deoxy-6-phosphogluconate aldolase